MRLPAALIAVGLAGQVHAMVIERTDIVDEVPPFACSEFTPRVLGLTLFAETEASLAGAGIGLQSIAFRQTLDAGRGVRDIVFVFQVVHPSNGQTVEAQLAASGLSADDFVATRSCIAEEKPGKVSIWNEFVSRMDRNRLEVKPDAIVFSIERRLRAAQEFEVSMPATMSPPARPADVNSVEPYAWASRANLTAIYEGERVLAVEKIECSDEGHFIVVSIGRLLQAPAPSSASDASAPDGATLAKSSQGATLIREVLFASNLYYGASGAPEDREAVEASIDPEHYWCVPRREICYESIEFGSFGLNLRKDRSGEVPRDKIYNLRLGIVTSLQRAAADHCQTVVQR